MMPVMDGLQFRREQQQDPTLASIPVVVLSATKDLQHQAAPLGVAALQKPIEVVRGLTTPRQPGILVIDDEPAIRTYLKMALGHNGLRVWLAADGREEVALYREHRDGIGLMLLDVQMPVLDGPWTLVALRQIDPEVRCCFMSGNTGDYDAEGLFALGACFTSER